MARKKSDSNQLDMLDIKDRLRTAVCVPAIREAVKTWRAGKYKGVTDITGELLNYWFNTDHILPNGNIFTITQHNAKLLKPSFIFTK